MMIDHMEETQKFLRKIRRIKIQEPKPGQYVERCHFSKTGWGIWEGNGCTCVPAKYRSRLDQATVEEG